MAAAMPKTYCSFVAKAPLVCWIAAWRIEGYVEWVSAMVFTPTWPFLPTPAKAVYISSAKSLWVCNNILELLINWLLNFSTLAKSFLKLLFSESKSS